MKQDIHPPYHTIIVECVNGDRFETRSTYGQPGDVLKLDIDTATHPAWTGGTQRLIERGQLARFNKRFAGFGLKS